MTQETSLRNTLEQIVVETMAEVFECSSALLARKNRSTIEVAQLRSAIIMFLILEAQYTKLEAALAVQIDRSSTFRIMSRHLKVQSDSASLSYFDQEYYDRYHEGCERVKAKMVSMGKTWQLGYASEIIAAIHNKYIAANM